MNPWEKYQARMTVRGLSKRDSSKNREAHILTSKLPTSLSYHKLTIDGIPRELAVINSDDLNIKTLRSLPGEDIPHGGLVYWMNNYWIITEKDANNELYTKATMQQCNYQLRWIADDKMVVERWCIITDGTKYLSGEYGDNQYVIVRGDSKVSLTIARDDYTVRLDRENRFLIDDLDSQTVLAYRLTKPFKLGGSFNGNGVLNFVLTECNTEDTDNLELRIANYYKYFPSEKQNGQDLTSNTKDPALGRKVWF